MELAIPALALGALYLVTNQASKTQKEEGYEGLPNVDIPDVNFPEDRGVINAETDLTSELMTVKHYHSSSKGPVEIAGMNYHHLLNARDKLARDGQGRAHELAAINERLSILDAEHEAEAQTRAG